MDAADQLSRWPAASMGVSHAYELEAPKEPAMTQTALPAPRLDSTPSLVDTCDQCGAAAKLRFELAGAGSLAFCGHHANEHAQLIARRATRVVVVEGFAWRGATSV